MKRIALFALLCASFAYASDHQTTQSGTILKMESADCGTDTAHKKMYTLLCHEYLLQTDSVIYRIRPRDNKNSALLPIGGEAQFHIEKNYIKLHVKGADNKDRDYIIVSMSPRADAQAADTHK